MFKVPMPCMVVAHFHGIPAESSIVFHEVTEGIADAEEDHITLRLFYIKREKPSFQHLDEDALEAEEERWLSENTQMSHYRLRWKDHDDALFNLHDFVPANTASVFPRWYELLCDALAMYISGYLFDSPWRLDSYETRAPEKLGGILENVPVLETPAERGACVRRREIKLQQRQLALQTDFFKDVETPTLYVTPR